MYSAVFFSTFVDVRKKRGCQNLEPVAICNLSCAKVVRKSASALSSDEKEILTTPTVEK